MQVKLSDPLPNIICSDCWRQTESFHEFHEKVLSDREKYLDFYLDVRIKKEPDSVLGTHDYTYACLWPQDLRLYDLLFVSVVERQIDEFDENMCVDDMTVEPVHFEGEVHGAHHEPVSNISNEDNEISVMGNNESISYDDLLIKSDYQYESNSWSGGDNFEEEFDDDSDDESSDGTMFAFRFIFKFCK